MPAYRFAWDAFDDRTVVALAEAWGHEGDDEARAWLEDSVKRPTPDFVRESKDALVDAWLPKYPGAKQIVDRLLDAGVGPMGQPRSQSGYVKYIASCRNSKRLRQYLCEAMLRFGDRDRAADADTALDFTPRFGILTPASQEADGRTPHDYQKDAWNQLNKHLAEARSTGVFQGLLVMPTGSGKTYTTVHWLLSHVIAAGGRVLWLAHRHELLTHAGAEFHRLSNLVRTKEKLRVRIVSGAHCATTQIDPADDIIVASVQSLARRPDITAQLLEDKKRFVVIDEAHHAPAKSYRDIIGQVQAKKPWHVLGLTATPTRTIEDERPILKRLFGGRIISQVDLPRLVEQRILARPIPVIVKTEAEVEEAVTDQDRSHYDRFGELSEEWLDRIAKLVNRNTVILDHYDANREKYGLTLMFAINVHHAALLAEQLRDRGVRADYVASYRPDGSEGDPMEVIRSFREGRLDVLVNVQMLTEGVDVPAVKTVFLTKPTMSEILMRQMIGRALRGPASGGAENAFLVSFEDHWEKFRDWDSPFDLVPDIEAIANTDETTDPVIRVVGEQLYEHLPWPTIRAVAASIRDRAIEHKADAFESVPHGWLVLERDDEDEGILTHIAVYEHQQPCWQALIAYLSQLEMSARQRVKPDMLYDEFFGDCDRPVPSNHHVGTVVEHFVRGGDDPEYHDLAGRKICDPYEVASKIHTEDLGRRQMTELVGQSYTSLAKAIYPNLREYQAAIDDALFEIDHPEEATRVHRAVPIFDPRADQQLSAGPCHDLDALMSVVLQAGAQLLDLPELTYGGTVSWSKRILKGWYGMAYLDEQPPLIRLNRLLDSPDVTSETIRFLLWHEFLHIHLRQGHTPVFRELERKWPRVVDADRELDTLNERFGIQYW